MVQSHLGQVEHVLAALEATRAEVAAHARRVAQYAVSLAQQYELDRDTIETIRLGALLHDVGKLLVSRRILDKPGRPTDREWQELRIHPQLGMDIAHRAGFDDDVCGIVLYHHEHFDGSGYPDGLAGQAIHFTARIVGVMDAFDALTSSRDYRKTLDVDAARAVIAREAGSKFCPWVVSGLLAMPAPMLTPRVVVAGPQVWPDLALVAPWAATPSACAVAAN